MGEIGQRIRNARKNRGLSGAQLGKLLKTTQSKISDWERDTPTPKLGNLERIAKALGINFEWLISGEGGMEKTEKNGRDFPRGDNSPSHLRDLASEERQKYGEIEISTPPSDVPGAMPIGWLPILGITPGGPPAEPVEAPLGFLPVPLPLIHSRRAYALQVMGYSMSPIIEDGDIIACEPYSGDRLSQGSIVVALVQGETTVKFYARKDSQHLLVALAPDFRPIVLGENDSILAHVVLVAKPSEVLPVIKPIKP